MATTPARRRRATARWRWKREGRRVRIARPPRRAWTSTTCCWAARPALDGGRDDDRRPWIEPEDLIAAAIDAAEDIRDPLEELVERAASDPGAAFVPDALERLAALKKEDRAAFEALRAQLKKAGCRVTALDEAIAEETGERRPRDRRRPIF